MFSANPLTYSAVNNLIGTYYTITISATGTAIASIQLTDSEDSVVATVNTGTLVYITTTQGTYTATITAVNGCVETQEITLE